MGRALEGYVQAENDLEENGGDEELEDALQSAAYGEADAKPRGRGCKQAQRRVEDILLPDEVTTELETARLEQTLLAESLQEYQKVLDNQGGSESALWLVVVH